MDRHAAGDDDQDDFEAVSLYDDGRDVAAMSDQQFSASMEEFLMRDVTTMRRVTGSGVVYQQCMNSAQGEQNVVEEQAAAVAHLGGDFQVNAARTTASLKPAPNLASTGLPQVDLLPVPAVSQSTSAGQTVSSDSDDEGNRKSRNAREAQRARLITLQIKRLGKMLREAKISFKASKHSTLAAASFYIEDLQKKAAALRR